MNNYWYIWFEVFVNGEPVCEIKRTDFGLEGWNFD